MTAFLEAIRTEEVQEAAPAEQHNVPQFFLTSHLDKIPASVSKETHETLVAPATEDEQPLAAAVKAYFTDVYTMIKKRGGDM
jgi:hypothetical protein